MLRSINIFVHELPHHLLTRFDLSSQPDSDLETKIIPNRHELFAEKALNITSTDCMLEDVHWTIVAALLMFVSLG